MSFVKGSSPKFFIAGLVLLVIATLLYRQSEQLGGIENYDKSKSLGVWAIVVFVPSVLCFALGLVAGFKSNKGK